MDCDKGKEILKRLRSLASPQEVLDVLWQVADVYGVVGRAVFKDYLQNLRKQIDVLEREECVMLTHQRDRGNRISRIRLLSRHAPKDKNGKAKKSDAERHVESLQKWQRRKAGAQADVVVEELPPPRCLVFVDVPNICHFTRNCDGIGGSAVYLHWVRARWRELRQIVLEITRISLDKQSCFAYLRPPKGNQISFPQACQNLTRAGFDVRKREVKDIDTTMVADLIIETIPYLQKNQVLKIVVVSGDGDYAYALNQVRILARKAAVQLSIDVITWRKQASKNLARVANQTHMIEDYLPRIDHTGATALEHDQKKRQ